MSEILGLLFLTDQQLATPKETGPGFREYHHVHSKSRTKALELGRRVVATTCLSEGMWQQ